jgi:hypothetical protein
MIDFSIFISKYFTNSFFLCYTYAVLLLLGVIVFKNKFTPEARNNLYVFNMLMGYVSLLGLLYWMLELFVAWYGQNPYELWAFYEGRNSQTSNPVVLYTFFLLPSLLGIFFLNKKFRLRIWFVILFLMVFNSGAIWNWLLQFDKDYLPSSWSVSYIESFWQKLSKWILLPVVLIFTYWILNKRKKLPHPSLFFKSDVQPL